MAFGAWERKLHDLFEEELLAGDEGFRRIRVDSDEAGFFAGNQYRIAYEFDLSTTANRRVIRVTVGTNTILTRSELVVDQGGVRYALVAGGTPTGTFDTPITVIPKNTMTTAPTPSSQLVFETGGDITGGTQSVIARTRSASGNNARATAVGTSDQKRGFGPTTLYLLLEDLPGVNDDSTGILNLEWEERE